MTKWQLYEIIEEFGINRFTGTTHLFSTFPGVGICSIRGYRAVKGLYRLVKLYKGLRSHIGDRGLRQPLRASYSPTVYIRSHCNRSVLIANESQIQQASADVGYLPTCRCLGALHLHPSGGIHYHTFAYMWVLHLHAFLLTRNEGTPIVRYSFCVPEHN